MTWQRSLLVLCTPGICDLQWVRVLVGVPASHPLLVVLPPQSCTGQVIVDGWMDGFFDGTNVISIFSKTLRQYVFLK